MPQQENKSISPRGQYLIPGASLLSVMDILESEIPCKYVHVLERVGSILGGVKELEIKPQPKDVAAEAVVDDPAPTDFPPSRG